MEKRYFIYFWDQRNPYVVKFDMEKRTGVLLDRVPAEPQLLVYSGERNSSVFRGRIQLRLEAATLNGILYSLEFAAIISGDSAGKVDEAFALWLKHMHVTDNPGPAEFAAGERYTELIQKALEMEAKYAPKPEDAEAVRAEQQKVLNALRGGKRYTEIWAHGRSSLQILFEGPNLVKRISSENPSAEIFFTEEQMLAFLRSYFDFAACRDTFPHKPPETVIWKYIGHQLR